MDPISVVESYLNSRSTKNYDDLMHVLSENVEYKSPLSKYFSADELVSNMRTNADGLDQIKLKKLFVDGSDVCAIFDQTTYDREVGDLTFTEWYKVEGDKIKSIEANFDSSPLLKSRSQI
jgi:hypothetical protein